MWTVEVSATKGKSQSGHVRCEIVDEQRHEVAHSAGAYENDEQVRLARTLAATPELRAACPSLCRRRRHDRTPISPS